VRMLRVQSAAIRDRHQGQMIALEDVVPGIEWLERLQLAVDSPPRRIRGEQMLQIGDVFVYCRRFQISIRRRASIPSARSLMLWQATVWGDRGSILECNAPFYGEIVTIDEPLACYRMHDSNLFYRTRLTTRVL
jgi:hypothetical protein